MTTPFEQVKDEVDIIEAAKFYSLRFKRDKAFCPFHNEGRTPNLSFKFNRYMCFSCGAKGSVIDLVMHLYQLSVIDAVKKLSADFGLNVPELNNSNFHISTAERNTYRQEKVLCDKFDAWNAKAHNTLATYYRQLNENILTHAPKDESEPLHPLFIEATHKKEYIGYILEQLAYGNFEDKLSVYKTYGQEVKIIEQKNKQAAQQDGKGTANKSIAV